jgi:hypothetical protein
MLFAVLNSGLILLFVRQREKRQLRNQLADCCNEVISAAPQILKSLASRSSQVIESKES